MRITIKSTVSEPQYSLKVAVEEPRDDLTIGEILEAVKRALVAYGYAPENVNEVFDSE